MQEKYCSGCKKNLPISEFSRKGSGYQSRCKTCRKLYCKKHYQDNKDYYKKKNQSRYALIRDWLREYKQKLVCGRCQFDDWRALEFHHSDPSEKEFTIAMAAGRGMSLERLQEEIDKCEVLCANCHAIEHYEE